MHSQFLFTFNSSLKLYAMYVCTYCVCVVTFIIRVVNWSVYFAHTDTVKLLHSNSTKHFAWIIILKKIINLILVKCSLDLEAKKKSGNRKKKIHNMYKREKTNNVISFIPNFNHVSGFLYMVVHHLYMYRFFHAF